MGPIEHIRRKVLRLTQAALGEVAGTTQASVSRWENGELEPGREEMDRIRSYAREQGIQWHDEWFFDVPAPSEPERAAS